MVARCLFFPLYFFACLSCSQILYVTSVLAHDESVDVLVFSRTMGYRHGSIEKGIESIKLLGSDYGFNVEATEDPNVFNEESLKHYQAVVFLNTTGDVLNSDQEKSFERFIQGGGGFVGIHSAADTEYDWPWYGRLVGAYFDSHPSIQLAEIRVIDAIHPATEFLPRRWSHTDEWYNYRANPRGRVHVLAVLDEESYEGGTQGTDHPIAWCHDFDGGRAWYTGLGHTEESYVAPMFLRHLLGGIQYAAGVSEGDCGASKSTNYEKVVLDEDPSNPIALDIASDGRVFYVERGGKIKIYHPDLGLISTAGELAVTTEFEDGLLGIALDPNFSKNNWVYLFYSPSEATAGQRVSRFTIMGGAIDLLSEKILLKIPTQRNECCHSGGALSFDSNGALYIAVGDNTNPFSSGGYTPIDERLGRSAWDAQRTSANTQDLRGKILRIIPNSDGSYTNPEDNLFSSSPEKGLPEIFVMGVRNPFRISVDSKRGWLYWGDVGPDAGANSVGRGPQGLDEWNRTLTGGNFGWPYCIGDNKPYVDFKFVEDESGISGLKFKCGELTNNSPNNTGPTRLPPAEPAWIWYPYGLAEDFPALGNASGRTAMAGPIYYFSGASTTALPQYYDETLIIYDWVRNWLRVVHFDESGEILQIEPFLSGMEFSRPIDMKIGPDGALYILEWGEGFWGDNRDAQLVRVEYARGTRLPVARINASTLDGAVPLSVFFDGAESFDLDPESTLTYAWDFDGDGEIDSNEKTINHTFKQRGNFTVTLQVTDKNGLSGSIQEFISVGNTRPEIRLLWPPNGGFFDWGTKVPFRVEVVDNEDESINCTRVRVQAFVGHDDHSHPQEQYGSCEGMIDIMSGHGSDADNLFYTIEAQYTDEGALGVDPLTESTGLVLQPLRKEAEHFVRQRGVRLQDTGDALGGGQNIGWIEHRDFISFSPINLAGIDSLTFRVASPTSGGFIEVRTDEEEGPLLGRVRVVNTGEWQKYKNVGMSISNPGGTHELFLMFVRVADDGQSLFNLNWIDFHGSGVLHEPATSIKNQPTVKSKPSLFNVYPNPSNGSVVVGFNLPEATNVRLELYNALGQRIDIIADRFFETGKSDIAYNTSILASGVYFFRVQLFNRTSIRRFVITR